MRELLRYLKEYKKESVIGPLFKMLEACFELAVPLIMAGIIDVGIKNSDRPYIWKMSIILVVLGVLGLTCSLIAQYFAAKAAMGFGTALRKDLFAHINRLSYAELDKIGTPTLVTRMTNDINQTQTGVNLVLRLFMRSPFIVAGAVVMAFSINIPITSVFLITVPVISLVIFLIVKLTIPIYKKAQAILDHVALLVRENHIGMRVVRAFSKQEREVERFETTTRQLNKTQVLSGKISALMNPLTYTIINLAIVAVLWSGSTEVYEGAISQGELTALVNYMSQILLALVALASLIIALTKATASASRITDVFHILPSIHEARDMSANADSEIKVEFDHVDFSYNQSGKTALEDISFRAMKGETIGIIGGTGAGKSTLVNLIPRFYDASGGQVCVDGVPVGDYPFIQLRTKIGIVPQKAVLFKGTIRDNMKWGNANATDEEIYEALDTAQAKEFVDKMAERLDARVQQGGRNFSGGQKQRLTIARALVAKPEILILDDSASALDYATDAALRLALKKSTRAATVFVVSQRVASVRHADQILVLDDGKLVGVGTHSQLMHDCPVYKEICVSQLREEEAV